METINESMREIREFENFKVEVEKSGDGSDNLFIYRRGEAVYSLLVVFRKCGDEVAVLTGNNKIKTVAVHTDKMGCKPVENIRKVSKDFAFKVVRIET